MSRLSAVWLVAVVCMIADHLGAYLIDGNVGFGLRLVGRVGLPCWGWMVAQGGLRTRDMVGYMGRLGGVALLTVPVYWLLTGRAENPVISLLIGLLALEAGKRWWWGFGLVGLSGVVGSDVYMCGAVVCGDFQGWRRWVIGVFWLLLYSWMTGVWWNLLGVLGLGVIEWGPVIVWRPGRVLKYSVYPGHLALLLLGREGMKWL